MTDKEKLNAIRVEVEEYINAARKAHTNITEGNFAHLLSFIDSLQEESTSTVYVVTRSEEHSDYVEKVFFDENKAQKYCDQFKGNENEYVRHITKVEVTL